MASDWHDGICDRCERETSVIAVEHPDHDTACLVCLDTLAEREDTTAEEIAR